MLFQICILLIGLSQFFEVFPLHWSDKFELHQAPEAAGLVHSPFNWQRPGSRLKSPMTPWATTPHCDQVWPCLLNTFVSKRSIIIAAKDNPLMHLSTTTAICLAKMATDMGFACSRKTAFRFLACFSLTPFWVGRPCLPEAYSPPGSSELGSPNNNKRFNEAAMG